MSDSNMRIDFSRVDLSQLVEVELKQNESVIVETLQRLGVGYFQPKRKIEQICHLIQIRDRFYIVHYKEIFGMTGRSFQWRKGELRLRNAIVDFLETYSYIHILNPTSIYHSYGMDIPDSDKNVFRIKHAQRNDWDMKTKINIKQFNKNLRKWNEEQKLSESVGNY